MQANSTAEMALASVKDSSEAQQRNLIGTLEHKLTAIERQLNDLSSRLICVYELVSSKVIIKEFYTTAEVARLLNRRPYTVREWCRHGRVHAVKTHAGRGEDEEWRINHEELMRIQNEGLLPLCKY